MKNSLTAKGSFIGRRSGVRANCLPINIFDIGTSHSLLNQYTWLLLQFYFEQLPVTAT